MRALWGDAQNISQMSLPYLRQHDAEYYAKLKPLVERPMTVAKRYRRLDLNLRWSSNLAKQTGKNLLAAGVVHVPPRRVLNFHNCLQMDTQ